MIDEYCYILVRRARTQYSWEKESRCACVVCVWCVSAATL